MTEENQAQAHQCIQQTNIAVMQRDLEYGEQKFASIQKSLEKIYGHLDAITGQVSEVKNRLAFINGRAIGWGAGAGAAAGVVLFLIQLLAKHLL